jgi:3-dehydroquinate synthase
MKQINTEKYNIYLGNDASAALHSFFSETAYSSLFILADEHTKKSCLPKIKRYLPALRNARVIVIKSGEKNKTIQTCIKIWDELSKQNADRRSLLINLGGGVITDMGGFAASTFKRGIDFVNFPTTLLAQVDASIGGKTGVDFNQFKNQVGLFAFPKAVFVIPAFLKTLSKRELLSGFAEVIKHGLISDLHYWKKIKSTNPLHTKNWEKVILKSIEIKNSIVSADAYEEGIRKYLNFGHTIGHAVESSSLKSKKPLLHGEAIATGMICEAYLSHKYCGLKTQELNEIIATITAAFHPKPIPYPADKLIERMYQDKKNNNSEINFSLLSAIGKAEINNFCNKSLIEESIIFFNSLYQ